MSREKVHGLALWHIPLHYPEDGESTFGIRRTMCHAPFKLFLLNPSMGSVPFSDAHSLLPQLAVFASWKRNPAKGDSPFRGRIHHNLTLSLFQNMSLLTTLIPHFHTSLSDLLLSAYFILRDEGDDRGEVLKVSPHPELKVSVSVTVSISVSVSVISLPNPKLFSPRLARRLRSHDHLCFVFFLPSFPPCA